MNTKKMIDFLRYMEAHDKAIFSSVDMATWFNASMNTVQQAIKRHSSIGLIIRVARGFYIAGINSSVLGQSPLVLVPYLRPGHFSYESFESRLYSFGLISQIPSVTTVATTGKSGRMKTYLGTLVFTHVEDEMSRRRAQTERDFPLQVPLATEELALYDLYKIQRNVGLVDEDAWDKYAWRNYAEE